MESRFPGKLKISGEAQPGNTGVFEVELEGGKVVHSKKNGDGYVDNEAKLEKICEAIKEALGA